MRSLILALALSMVGAFSAVDVASAQSRGYYGGYRGGASVGYRSYYRGGYARPNYYRGYQPYRSYRPYYGGGYRAPVYRPYGGYYGAPGIYFRF